MLWHYTIPLHQDLPHAQPCEMPSSGGRPHLPANPGGRAHYAAETCVALRHRAGHDGGSGDHRHHAAAHRQEQGHCVVLAGALCGGWGGRRPVARWDAPAGQAAGLGNAGAGGADPQQTPRPANSRLWRKRARICACGASCARKCCSVLWAKGRTSTSTPNLPAQVHCGRRCASASLTRSCACSNRAVASRLGCAPLRPLSRQ